MWLLKLLDYLMVRFCPFSPPNVIEFFFNLRCSLRTIGTLRMQFAVEMAITLMGIDCELVADHLPDFVFLVFL